MAANPAAGVRLPRTVPREMTFLTAQGGNTLGLGWQFGSAGNEATFLDVGAFISAIIYFLVFMAVVYFVIVLPYKYISARRGVTVFGEPGPTTTWPTCLSDDLPAAASKCNYCGNDLAASGVDAR